MMIRYVSMLLPVLLLLASCSGMPNNTRPQAWLKPGVRVTLPAPGISPAISQQQLLTATVKGRDQSLLVLLNADHERLSLVGLSSLGIRLFTLSYDASGIHTTQSIVLPELPPASQVLADIMLSYWPVASWQSSLPAGWTLQDQEAGQDNKRQLRDSHGTLVSEITYVRTHGIRQPVAIHQVVFDYRILIQPLEN